MQSYANRVKDSTTTTGTGDITLAGAPPSGFQSFAAGFSLNERFEYTIELGADWECGEGYLSASTTLVRAVVTASSNAGAAVNFPAGGKTVFAGLTARGAQRMATTGRLIAMNLSRYLP